LCVLAARVTPGKARWCPALAPLRSNVRSVAPDRSSLGTAKAVLNVQLIEVQGGAPPLGALRRREGVALDLGRRLTGAERG